jgi:chromosome segregation ATPase
MRKTLFDDNISEHQKGSQFLSENAEPKTDKEDKPLERLKNLDDKIADAISKVKALKEEKTALERRIKELEALLNEKNGEIERLSSEKTSIKGQISELLSELESLEIG